MKNKLTLRIEESLIKDVKKYAEEKKTSVSQLVADYFRAIQSKKKLDMEELKLPPKTESLSGILKNRRVDEKDYKTHLENKHLK